MKKVKSAFRRIIMSVLALVFTVTLAVPKAKAVTGVDDVAVGIMAVLVHLDSIGGSLAVQQGTALATQNAVTALATQAGAAGALGAGVTGTAALATIGAAVTAFAGGYTIGYIGYEMLTKLAEWIRQASLTGTSVNKIYMTGGPFETLLDGSSIYSRLSFDTTYQTQAGSSFRFTKRVYPSSDPNEPDKGAIYVTTVSTDGVVQEMGSAVVPETKWQSASFESLEQNTLFFETDILKWGRPVYMQCRGAPWEGVSNVVIYVPPYPSDTLFNFDKVFVAPPGETREKQEVTYVPPVTWSPPAPAPGQDVYYKPYPNVPDKTIEKIVEDVPKDIYDNKFNPAPPQVNEPSVPPVNPDLPPVVNPNPPVEPPAEVEPYTVQLGDVFPFCIPFDVYHMVTLFVAEPEAPHAKWEFSLPFVGGTYQVEWDLQEWDEVAALCRKLELVLFCVGLAVVTSKLIKW